MVYTFRDRTGQSGLLVDVVDARISVVSLALGAADAREFLTDFSLTVPALTAGFKVYVVLNTGNERGSEAVYVTRP